MVVEEFACLLFLLWRERKGVRGDDREQKRW